MSTPAPLLCFHEVGMYRRDGGAGRRVVLRQVSFELEVGASMGVYGERRAGKSTLLRLAAGVVSPDEGSVYFARRDLRESGTRLLRGPVALLTAWDGPTAAGEAVMDHVAVGAGSLGLSLREARRTALEALELCGVPGALAQEAVFTLAPGERARVALARALVRGPQLLLVDELALLPSLLERDRFCALLRTLARERNIALLVASEDMSALQGMDALASLSNGELCSTRQAGKVVELSPQRMMALRWP